MKITRVEPILLSVPLPAGRGVRWSGGEIDVLPTVLVRVHTDAGLSGLGDSYGVGIFAPTVARALIEHYEPMLTGEDPMDVARLTDALYTRSLFWGRSGAAVSIVSTIENALWDIAGQALGVPVYQLLGGAAHQRLPIYASGGLDRSPEETRAELEGYVDQGFRAIKVRIGHDPARDRAKVKLARRTVGDGITLMVDAVQGHNPRPWSAAQALASARAIEEFEPAWLEEPCAAYDYQGYAEVRRGTTIPIAGGESSTMVHEFRHFFDAEALDVAQPDAVHAGGILECLRIAALAEVAGVRIAPHAWGSAVCLLANYHAGFATRNCAYVEYPTFGNPLRDELLVEPLRIEDGYLLPPRAPGLGVRLPEDLPSRYPYRPDAGITMRRG
jgi:L-alanine-DL-glutamate epimerase-like enolase superfamily enzyme